MKFSAKLSSFQLILLSFVGLIGAGTLGLLLPGATYQGISLTNALFTATSAVCVTGLIVVSTPQTFTLFGQTVILLLIQAGGLGFLTLGILISLMMGKKVGLTEKKRLQEFWNLGGALSIARFLKLVVFFVVTVELVGALGLALRFAAQMPWGEAAFYGLFHSVSAFNNAGFSLWDDNLMSYGTDFFVVLWISGLVILGGLGFLVLFDLKEYVLGRRIRLSLHSKLALASSGGLLLFGFVGYLLVEHRHLFLDQQTSWGEQLLLSWFASVTARTAGFNTWDYAQLQPATLLLTMLLMWIGASPGSTGGGIKNTTFAVILLHLWATLRGHRETRIWRRTLAPELVSKAMVIVTLSGVYIFVVTFLIEELETTNFIDSLFEVISAFATVGLSIGAPGGVSFSGGFGEGSKLLLSLTMLLGRVGPVTLFMALLLDQKERISYPKETVYIG
ncbi:MAG: hypothetical protein A2600_11440 [Candidatus Lambdaproteobacteria bacterium RIFOXYD1_FULL_56_27]|uniref:Trk family potassium uptake protein n=1 Tax=Candidatus Lambdaproteobacteria bacterium RIFOXYD2_FULL_56_26 TaxID=1817773 RepID=A0A1F6H110_9PROT|nr:MAG: hypothetical protein A2426_12560 [Candidatus Lambdaproteobacteria bacterium RIFOXYC1_FULL_56_13]OGH03984.1 MAG: hypothetical protein A2557_11200 [Candidatus Lambdaproteobacteria bacterium RIFOXYD2_FULL_56_26]OGH08375.1 MAG: hypothetical protein A2600_11440 [Candidatus Lambdaproteobacteria bacterium RIFOXYD1_FULL_56_27]